MAGRLFTNKFLDQKMDYIHMNPVAAGIVEEPEEYLLSSARDYRTNKKGLVEICYIE
jgi:putative transposase